MKFVLGFIAGASIAASAALMVSPSDMKKVRRKCKYAKRALMDMI